MALGCDWDVFKTLNDARDHITIMMNHLFRIFTLFGADKVLLQR